MRHRATVIHGVGQNWSIQQVDVDSPKAGEDLVKWTRVGLCHSDEHVHARDRVPPLGEGEHIRGVITHAG